MIYRSIVLTVALCIVRATPVLAQVQAIDGVIEGLVLAENRAVITGATVRAIRVDTGLVRETVTDGSGRYRFLLVPPGTYRLECEIAGFTRAQWTGLIVRAGEVTTQDVVVGPGQVAETVTVTAETPPTRPGNIDAGRTLAGVETARLPLVLRNPLDLALLTPGVTGSEADEINQPRLNANGAQMRNSFQIDGNTNTERDRAGLRLMPMSPLFVNELKVTTSGYAPEFGQASGVVVNVVTPSGTNVWRGEAGVDVSLPQFLARPALLPADAPRPATRAAVFMGSTGGPIRRDRLHFYVGYHRIRRDSSSGLITVDPENARRLGLTLPAGLRLDEGQTEHFGLAKLDYQVTPAHRASLRLVGLSNNSPLAGVSGLSVPDRAVDVFARIGSGALQVVSVTGGSAVNEFRAQYAERRLVRRASDTSAPLPAIDIPGVASFGGPAAAVQSAGATFDEASWQVVDNYTWQSAGHTLKAGLDLQRIVDRRVNTLRRLYTFSTIESYLAASSGVDPLSFSRYLEDVGEPAVTYRTTFVSLYLQDDARLARRVTLVYGLRYDVFGTPKASGAAVPTFRIDWTNLAPRAGLAWSLDEQARTVIRGSVGRVFDPPPLLLYEDAIVHGTTGRIRTVILRPHSAGAPSFPDQAGAFSQPPSTVEIGDDFETQASWMAHVEVERVLRSGIVVSVAYAHTTGSHLPVLVDENLIPSGATLEDGRPTYSATVSSATRVDPLVDHADVVRSIARANYDALILTLRTRSWRSMSLQASYTFARARDNSPLTNVYVQGSQDDRPSDPSNLDRDYGPTPFDQPHAFTLSALVVPEGWGHGWWSAVTRHTHVGASVLANAGMPANIRSNVDLNGDGQLNDRPIGVPRNSGRVGRVVSVDLKIERTLWTSGRAEAVVSASIKNVLNTMNVLQVNRVVQTDTLGRPLAPIPAVLPATATYDGRRMELSLRVRY